MAGWLILFSVGFVLGSAWRAAMHRCRPVDVHTLDEAYRRGVEDGIEQAVSARLERMWEAS
jgi:hypothetical protein